MVPAESKRASTSDKNPSKAFKSAASDSHEAARGKCTFGGWKQSGARSLRLWRSPARARARVTMRTDRTFLIYDRMSGCEEAPWFTGTTSQAPPLLLLEKSDK